MTDAPTLAEQLEAVEWAIKRLDDMALRDDELTKMRPRLVAASGTLFLLDLEKFAKETLK